MADSTLPLTTAATPTAGVSSSSTSTSIFSRRPSFFKSNKHTARAPSTSLPPPSLLPAPSENPLPLPAAASASSAASAAPVPSVNLPPDPPPTATNHAADQYDRPTRVPSTPPRRRQGSRHSISSSITDFGTQLRRSSSHKRTPSATLAHSYSPEKALPQANGAPPPSKPALSISTFARSKQKSVENVRLASQASKDKEPQSAVDNPKTPFGMNVPMRYPPSQKDIQQVQRQQSFGGSFNGPLAPAAPISIPNGANPNIIFQHIHEMASKRISTLDYLRKAHEGRIYWFNTLLFSKADLTRLPSFTPRNLARRATHYLLLGFSLPTILDLNANNPTDYLKALNALLLEFEQYQSIHPADGSAPSSLSRGRIPQMFKRANITGKGRRSSSAANDFPTLTPQGSFNEPTSNIDSPPTDDLLPNESYTHLQTPSLPFDPDFFSTFATLCDVLIDCYTKILSLLSTPESVVVAGAGIPSTVGELFNKADARVRKIILQGVVREFEESCRQGVRGEVGGVGKVVLGGLM